MDINNKTFEYKFRKYKHKYNKIFNKLKKYNTGNKILEPVYLLGLLPKKMKNIHTIKYLKLCSYNIWSELNNAVYTKLEKRLPYIIDEVIKDDPDIICLQDVSNIALEYMKTRPKLSKEYFFFFHKDINKNNTIMMLSKFKPRKVHYYDYYMIMEFPNYIIINTKIDRKIKNKNNEIDKIIKTIKKFKDVNIIFTGDVNFDVDKVKSSLNKLNLNDAWLKIKNNPVNTEDTTINKMNWNFSYVRTQERNNIILTSNKINPNKIRLIGEQPVFTIDKDDKDYLEYLKKNKLDVRFVKYTNDKIQFWPSNKFGLMMEI